MVGCRSGMGSESRRVGERGKQLAGHASVLARLIIRDGWNTFLTCPWSCVNT